MTSVTQTDTGYNPLLPWWDQVEWATDPALAYLKGLQDGIELGREQENARIYHTFAHALGGPNCHDLAEGIQIHIAQVEAKQRRDAWRAAVLTGEDTQ